MRPFLTNFLRIVMIPFRTLFARMKVHCKNLSIRILISDFVSVASSIGFVSVPAFVAGVVFLILPQGRDTILLVIEKAVELDYFPLFFLLLSLLLYSGFAELSVRYAIYISDNSGKNLSYDRVFFRQTCQKMLAGFFLLWPFLMILIGFAICFFKASYLDLTTRLITMGTGAFLVLTVAAVMILLYFSKKGIPAPGNPQTARLGERSLSQAEKDWISKLYGIYDDYIYSLPKPTSFLGAFKKDLKTFTARFITAPKPLGTFLQDPTVMQPMRLIPPAFQLKNLATVRVGKGAWYRWIFKIPTNFYQSLHRQILLITLFSVGLTVLLSTMDVKSGTYQKIGAPALICFAFACYCGLYSGLLFLDRGLLRSWQVSVRLLLVVAVLTFSYLNHDHPVSIQTNAAPQRSLIATQFDRWFKEYRKQVDLQRGLKADPSRKYPVFFICSEGGALRTGAYTGIYLTKLEDTLSRKFDVNFRSSLFAMSGVSGGAVGLGFYNAMAFRSNIKTAGASTQQATSFFSYDALSPLIGKMLFGEFLNLLWPRNIERFNRAVALEESWEVAYGKTINKGEGNIFEKDYISSTPDSLAPLLIINTSEVETGLQCWVSTLSPDTLTFKEDRDLLASKLKQIKYSTAINFSSRFPILSPAAANGVKPGETKYHYLDGGYVENTGAASMLETLQLLEKKSPEFRNVVPVMIYLLFSDDSAKPVASIDFGNEITEVILGIYNTRSGRTKTSQFQLEQFVKKYNQGINIFEPLSSSDVPMNWTLSGQSIKNIDADIAKKLKETGANGILQKIFSRNLPYLKERNRQNTTAAR